MEKEKTKTKSETFLALTGTLIVFDMK